jgi:predicted CoA-binding protein
MVGTWGSGHRRRLIDHLDKIRAPSPEPRHPDTIDLMFKTVAVIGASSKRHKFGNKAVRAYVSQGYRVLAINPNEEQVEGIKTYASVLDVPGPIDMATVYVPGHIGVRVMEDIAKKGIPEVWLNPGADDDEVVERAKALGVRIIQACSIMAIGEAPGRY